MKIEKIISALLALAMVLAFTSVVAVPASAAGGTCGENLTWDYTSGVLTISGTGDMTDFGSNGPWYSYRNSIKTVTIGNGVTSIGSYAFYNCTKITTVTLPNTVTAINEYAFRNCTSLSGINIPSNLKVLGKSAFNNCQSIKSIVLPDSVTSIGSYAFVNCYKLAEVVLPPELTSIPESLLFGCEALTNVTIPAGVTSIERNAFYQCQALTSIAIPGKVTSIGGQAFFECSALKTIVFCGKESAWELVEKENWWNEGTPAEIQFHNYVDGICTECGKGENPLPVSLLSTLYCEVRAALFRFPLLHVQ